MNESILNSIKKLLGIANSCRDFDTDIIIHINTSLMILNQLGIGEDGFQIKDEKDKWNDFIDTELLEGVKTYVYLKVRILFDPPHNSATIESLKENLKELEWRLNVRKETESDEEV